MLRNRIIEVNCIGDVNASLNNVVPFVPRQQSVTIFLPANFIGEIDSLLILQACGNSLINDRINNGDMMIFQTKIEESEIKSNICAIYVHTRNEYFAKRIRHFKDKVILYSNEFDEITLEEHEIEVLGILLFSQVAHSKFLCL